MQDVRPDLGQLQAHKNVNWFHMFLTFCALTSVSPLVIVCRSEPLLVSPLVIHIHEIHHPHRSCALRSFQLAEELARCQARAPRITSRIAIRAANNAPPTLGLLSTANA